FWLSSFRYSVQGPVSRPRARTIGVLPTSSRMDSWVAMRKASAAIRGFYRGLRPRPPEVRGESRAGVAGGGGRRGRPPLPACRSVRALVHPGQAILRGQLLALHLPEGGIVDRQHAEVGVQHLLVQFLVPVVQLPELGAGLHHRFEFRLRLSFEHGNLLSGLDDAEPGRTGRGGAVGGGGGPPECAAR